MSSNINPNNIDTTYPIAGQDNDSQGFRDNFTNIKSNFQYAEDEITDLQNKVILKAALDGTTLDNDFGGALVTNGKIQGFRATRVALGSSSELASNTAVIDYDAGHFYTVSLDSNCTLDFQNWPSAGNQCWVRVTVTVTSTSYTLTLPAAVSVGVTGIQGYSSNVITFAATGTYAFEFTTSNGGSTITVQDLNRPLNYYTNPLYLAVPDTFAANGNVSLTTTTTVVSQSSNMVGNLHAGSSGQIKILAYGNTSVGNTLITVENAAWGGDSLANLSTVGSACTLQYTDSKWFCVGNNGVTFS